MSDAAYLFYLSGLVRSNVVQTVERNDEDMEEQYDTSCSPRKTRVLMYERHVVRWGVIATILEDYWLEHLKRKAMRAMWIMLNEVKQHQTQRTVGHQDVTATPPSFIF